jgi:hypothetical protein
MIMNKTANTLLLSFMLTLFFYGCSADFWHPGDTVNTGPASKLASQLASLPENTITTPHKITLKVGSYDEFGIIRKALQEASNKYVSIDLTGSTVKGIEGASFYGCANLTSVTIPNNIISIGEGAFYDCNSLTSVLFQGTIPSNGFSYSSMYPSFPGNLRTKFYESDKTNGTPGTYTRAIGGNTWTRQ